MGGGGKGGGGSAAPAEPQVVDNSNPGLDMYLAEQAANNQAAMQQQELNARLMQAPQQGDPGLRPPQQQEQDIEGGYDPNSQLSALINALRGEA